jgi:hypothetical protein
MLGIFGVLAQSQAHQAAIAQQRRHEAEHRARCRTPEQQLYASANAHARDLRNSIRGRTWKCGPWTWET